MRRSRALAALALPLLLVACGGTSATPTPVPATPAPTVAPSAAPAGSGEVEVEVEVEASLGPVPSGALATTVDVEVVDYAFMPSAITVPAGEITFVLTNNGTQEHEFEIFKGDAVVDEAEGLVPGLARDFVVTLPAGDYTYVCKLADHEARGMKGTLTVTEG